MISVPRLEKLHLRWVNETPWLWTLVNHRLLKDMTLLTHTLAIIRSPFLEVRDTTAEAVTKSIPVVQKCPGTGGFAANKKFY